MKEPAARTIASRMRRVSLQVRRGEYDGELCDMVSTALRVTESGKLYNTR